MRLTSWVLILTASFWMSAGQALAQNQNANQELPITWAISIATAQTTVKVGSDVFIQISLTNRSGRTIHVFWLNDTAKYDEYKIVVLDEAGKMPPRTPVGRIYVDHDPDIVVGEAHVIPNRDVKDGEVLKENLDISKLFVLQPGKYTVQLERGEGATAAKSNTITLTVIP
jgi:hypothetical protein